MSAFIKLKKQDAIIAPYTTHKLWSVTNDQTGSYGIKFYTALSSSGTVYVDQANVTTDNQYAELVYRNLHHLYYSRFITGSAISSSYYNYDQTTLHESASRQLYETASLISIPKEIYGQSIKPGTFRLTGGTQNTGFVSASFVSGGFIERFETDGTTIYDDGEGVLRDLNNDNAKVGDIIYTHGHAILTDKATIDELNRQLIFSLAFRSSYTMFAHSYRCRVNESQLNYSQNPSIKSGSNGYLYDFATGSNFQPYVTTVGLYNGANELVAIGKLGQPIPKTRYVDTTFVINFDI